MQIGVVFPQTELGAAAADVRAYAQAIQQLGYRHVLIYDHVLGADPSMRPGWTGYSSDSLFHEPFVVFGYLAAVAPELELVTGVIVLPQRQTALVAKQAAEVDILTSGKLRLGVGIGWNAVEYEGLGANFRDRGRRFDEQIALLRRLWTEPIVTFVGQDHRITAAGLNPLPIQRPIPIWIGASAERALKRAAETADGYFPQRPLAGGWAATLDRLHGWLEGVGRDPTTFGIDARISVATGTPDEWHAEAEEWRARGATHLSLNTMGGGLQGPDSHVERLREALPAVLG